jgi:hypothetical protein
MHTRPYTYVPICMHIHTAHDSYRRAHGLGWFGRSGCSCGWRRRRQRLLRGVHLSRRWWRRRCGDPTPAMLPMHVHARLLLTLRQLRPLPPTWAMHVWHWGDGNTILLLLCRRPGPRRFWPTRRQSDPGRTRNFWRRWRKGTHGWCAKQQRLRQLHAPRLPSAMCVYAGTRRRLRPL